MEVVSEILPLAPEKIRGALADLMRMHGAAGISPDRYQHNGLAVSLTCATNVAGQTLAEFRIEAPPEEALRSTVEAEFDAELKQKTAESKAKTRAYNTVGILVGVGGGICALLIGVVVGFYSGLGWGILTWIAITLLFALSAKPSYDEAKKAEDAVKAMAGDRSKWVATATEAKKSPLRARAASLRAEVEAMVKRMQFSAA